MMPTCAAVSGHGPPRLLLQTALVVALSLPVASRSDPDLAMTEVVAVEQAEVVLGAGRLDGLAVDAEVTLLREGEPIIHPLTGEVLGVPQEPVAMAVVTEAGDHQARAVLDKTYSEPRAGDLVEFRPVSARPAVPGPEVTSVLEEVEALRQDVEQVRQRERDLRTYPAFARKVLDEIGAMRSYLTSIDERLVELEEQQSADHFRLSSVVSGEPRQQDYEELTIRYAPNTQVRLRAAGKTLTIDVVGDTLHMAPVPASATAPQAEGWVGSRLMGLFGGGDDEGGGTEVSDLTGKDEKPWYISTVHLAAGVGLSLALLIMVFLVVRRRYTDVMDGLDEFDDYLEDEDDDDE